MIMDSLEGDVWLAAGGSGGSRIFGSVAQVLLNLDWGYDVANAVEQQRVHDQLLPQTVCSRDDRTRFRLLTFPLPLVKVTVESGFRDDILDSLRARGHILT